MDIPKEKGMKKVLVLSAVLFCVATISQASILNVEVSTDWAPIAGGYGDPECWDAYFNVIVSFKITADPNISLTEDLVNKGLCDYAVTLYTPGTNGYVLPIDDGGNVCFAGAGSGKANATWRTSEKTYKYIPAQRKYQMVSLPPYWGETLANAIPAQIANVDGSGDPDLDCIQFSNGASSLSGDHNLANQGTFEWVFQTQMYLNVWAKTEIHAYVAPSSRHYDPDDPSGKAFFSNYTSNVLVVGPQGVAPTISLVGPGGKVNTLKGTNTAPVGFLMTVTNEASPVPVATSIVYGDGAGEAGTDITVVPGGTAAFNHTYTLAGGVNQAGFTATGTAANGITPDGTADATVTIVQSPTARLQVSIDGDSFFDVFADGVVNVGGHTPVSLSMVNSSGYIETWLITKGGTLSSGPTWGGESNVLYGVVHFQVGNSGSGDNTDGFDVTFIPEPATLALLGVGAMVSLLRRRK
jgi:hypothetical protein